MAIFLGYSSTLHLLLLVCLLQSCRTMYRSGSGVEEEDSVLGGHNSCRQHIDRALFSYSSYIYINRIVTVCE